MFCDWIIWLNTLGLTLGVAGAFGLALLTKVFITVEQDGTQYWGPPPGISNEEWLRRNKILWIKQKYGLPVSYGALSLGFVCQLIGLWMPEICIC